VVPWINNSKFIDSEWSGIKSRAYIGGQGDGNLGGTNRQCEDDQRMDREE
jgi:hypothetical protein